MSDYVLVPRALLDAEGVTARSPHCDDLLKAMEDVCEAAKGHYCVSPNDTRACSICRALARLSSARESKEPTREG